MEYRERDLATGSNSFFRSGPNRPVSKRRLASSGEGGGGSLRDIVTSVIEQ